MILCPCHPSDIQFRFISIGCLDEELLFLTSPLPLLLVGEIYVYVCGHVCAHVLVPATAESHSVPVILEGPGAWLRLHEPTPEHLQKAPPTVWFPGESALCRLEVSRGYPHTPPCLCCPMGLHWGLPLGEPRVVLGTDGEKAPAALDWVRTVWLAYHCASSGLEFSG